MTTIGKIWVCKICHELRPIHKKNSKEEYQCSLKTEPYLNLPDLVAMIEERIKNITPIMVVAELKSLLDQLTKEQV